MNINNFYWDAVKSPLHLYRDIDSKLRSSRLGSCLLTVTFCSGATRAIHVQTTVSNATWFIYIKWSTATFFLGAENLGIQNYYWKENEGTSAEIEVAIAARKEPSQTCSSCKERASLAYLCAGTLASLLRCPTLKSSMEFATHTTEHPATLLISLLKNYSIKTMTIVLQASYFVASTPGSFRRGSRCCYHLGSLL